ncbi:MAG: hypothetical protein IPM12_11410 [Flavobacteriales bacterium]|nr:hypothetical protein [Flavobacteriales bacterium]
MGKTYKKTYGPASIRLVGRYVQGRIHLLLAFNYGFRAMEVGRSPQYLTLRVTTGHAVDASEWDMTEQAFSGSFMKKKKDQLVQITEGVAELRAEVWNTFKALSKELGGKPHPDQILARLKVDTEQITPIPLADYIREIIADPNFCNNIRTRQKYSTTAALLDMLPVIRSMAKDKTHPLFGWIKGEGEVMLGNFTPLDWTDFSNLIARSTEYLPYADPKDMKSTDAWKWAVDEQPSRYSVNTLEKYQQQIKTTLNHAIENKRIKSIDTTSFVSASREHTVKPYLTAEELSHLVLTKLDKPHLENCRQLMVLQGFTGVDITDLRQVLTKDIQWFKGKTFDFTAIRMVRTKPPMNEMVIPLFTPALDVLKGVRPVMPPDDQTHNRHIKEVALAMGFNRLYDQIEVKVRGKKSKKEQNSLPLHSVLSSHDFRRTTKQWAEEDMGIARDLVCQMMGHKLPDKSADRAYLNRPLEKKAELLVIQAMAMADEVFPGIDLINVRFREPERRRA